LEKRAEVNGKRKLLYISDTICKIHYSSASEFSKKEILPLANDIYVKSRQEIERLSDRLESKAHQASAEAALLWEQQYDKHWWVKTLKHHGADAVNHFTALHLDVYNA
jgi:hypothetical protein